MGGNIHTGNLFLHQPLGICSISILRLLGQKALCYQRRAAAVATPQPRRPTTAAPPLFIPSLTSHKRIFHHTQYGTVSLSHRRGCCKIVLQKDTSTLGTKMFGSFTDLYDSSLVVMYGESHSCRGVVPGGAGVAMAHCGPEQPRM